MINDLSVGKKTDLSVGKTTALFAGKRPDLYVGKRPGLSVGKRPDCVLATNHHLPGFTIYHLIMTFIMYDVSFVYH